MGTGKTDIRFDGSSPWGSETLSVSRIHLINSIRRRPRFRPG